MCRLGALSPETTHTCAAVSLPLVSTSFTVSRRRIFQYYIPVFFWCQRQLQQHRAAAATESSTAPPPLVLGISAPQGCGKTTLCEQLEALFGYTGAAAAAISVDDFYRTRAGQQEGGAGQCVWCGCRCTCSCIMLCVCVRVKVL